MDRHELAMKTYNDLKKRKKQREQQELQHKIDLMETGWNGYTKFMVKRQKRYYDRRHTIF